MTGTFWRGWVALLGSFGVYLVPLFGPHAAWLLGAALLLSVGGDRSLAWTMTDISVALASQIAAGLVLYWSLGGGWARKIVWIGVIPLTLTLNIAYLWAIPAFFLIEADTASEVNTWAEHCFVRDVGLRS